MVTICLLKVDCYTRVRIKIIKFKSIDNYTYVFKLIFKKTKQKLLCKSNSKIIFVTQVILLYC